MAANNFSHRANDLTALLEKESNHGFDKLWDNPWSETNPTGNVNLCTAINRMCDDLLLKKLSDPESWKAPITDIANYRLKFGGYLKTKVCVAGFIDQHFKSDSPLDPNELTLMSACGAAFHQLAWILANPGDVFLVPSPHYAYVYFNCKELAMVDTVPVPTETDEDRKFYLSLDNFAKVFEQITWQGKKVRGIILLNPQNPLGRCYSFEDLLPILQFAHQRNIYVIFDEIYAKSIYDRDSKFASYHSFRSRLPDPQRTVWMWSFSKDMCLPGLRFGALHTANEDLRKILSRHERINSVPQLCEHFVINILSDKEWFDKVFTPNKLRRLAERHDYTSSRLKQLGIGHVKADGGHFLFIDLRKFLAEQTFAAEEALFTKLSEAGVFLNPGNHMNCPEPGWFRLVFSQEKAPLELGITRLFAVLKTL